MTFVCDFCGCELDVKYKCDALLGSFCRFCAIHSIRKVRCSGDAFIQYVVNQSMATHVLALQDDMKNAFCDRLKALNDDTGKPYRVKLVVEGERNSDAEV